MYPAHSVCRRQRHTTRKRVPRAGYAMQILVNDQSREVPDSCTVAKLLEQLGLSDKPVAVEVNLKVVPRTQHAEHVLSSNDHLEIVTLVGGG
jgi:sulfur carrier protein